MSESTLKIPKLSRDGDYREWAQMMKAYLITKGRLDKALTAEPRENDSAAEERDLLCLAHLQLHVTGPLQSVVARAKSAKAAWDALKEEYQGSLKSRQPQLVAQLTELSQGSKSTTDYVDKLLSLRDEFEALQMHASLPILASQFIRGLRDDLRVACAPILLKLGQKDEDSCSIDDIAREVKALAALLPDSSPRARLNHTRVGRPQPVCWNCGQKGHTARKCPKQHDEERVRRHYHEYREKRGGRAQMSEDEDDHPAHVMTVMATQAGSRRGIRDSFLWMDSGATHHIVHDEKVLKDVRKPSTQHVTLGGGETHSVKAEGDLLLKGGPSGSVLLTGVLHVPTLNINLLSTTRITSKGGSCWSGPKNAQVYNRRGEVVLHGEKIDGMYRVSCNLPDSPVMKKVVAMKMSRERKSVSKAVQKQEEASIAGYNATRRSQTAGLKSAGGVDRHGGKTVPRVQQADAEKHQRRSAPKAVVQSSSSKGKSKKDDLPSDRHPANPSQQRNTSTCTRGSVHGVSYRDALQGVRDRDSVRVEAR